MSGHPFSASQKLRLAPGIAQSCRCGSRGTPGLPSLEGGTDPAGVADRQQFVGEGALHLSAFQHVEERYRDPGIGLLCLKLGNQRLSRSLNP